MKNDPLVAKLYNKMQQEQNEYRAWLLAQPPEEILNHAYEYSSREDILMAFENVSLRPAQLRALLESQAPLADIYKDYRDHDTNALDAIAEDIELTGDMLQWQLPEGFTGSITPLTENSDDLTLYDAQSDTIYLYNPYQLSVLQAEDPAKEPVPSPDEWRVRCCFPALKWSMPM